MKLLYESQAAIVSGKKDKLFHDHEQCDCTCVGLSK